MPLVSPRSALLTFGFPLVVQGPCPGRYGDDCGHENENVVCRRDEPRDACCRCPRRYCRCNLFDLLVWFCHFCSHYMLGE
jgi:hypothetical protein